MRPSPIAPLGALFGALVLVAGCAQKSDSLYRPLDTTVSNPSSAPLGDELDQDREHLDNAAKAREESLREQRKTDDDDNDD